VRLHLARRQAAAARQVSIPAMAQALRMMRRDSADCFDWAALTTEAELPEV